MNISRKPWTLCIALSLLAGAWSTAGAKEVICKVELAR